MFRTITILGLVQAILVVVGFFGLGIVLKVSGYPKEGYGLAWNTLALLLRRHGLFLLLVPVTWTIFAAMSLNRAKFILTTNGWAVVGILSSAIIAGLFIYACVDPYTRLLIIGH